MSARVHLVVHTQLLREVSGSSSEIGVLDALSSSGAVKTNSGCLKRYCCYIEADTFKDCGHHLEETFRARALIGSQSLKQPSFRWNYRGVSGLNGAWAGAEVVVV